MAYTNTLKNGLRTTSVVNDSAGNRLLTLTTHESLGSGVCVIAYGGDQIKLTQANATDLAAALAPFIATGLLS
jgi:hypothetical protein